MKIRIAVVVALFCSIVSFSAHAEIIDGRVVPADEQSSCDIVIVDDAQIFGVGVSDVERAAQNLANLGAVVRVRTLQSMGGAPSLEHIVAGLEGTCDSWQAADGGTRNNLVVFLIAVEDRESGIFAGSQWAAALESQIPRVKSDKMDPRFREYDFAGGFAAGINEVTRLVDLANHPQSTASTPTDFSGLWKVFGWGLALIAGFLAIIFISKSASRKKQEQEQRRAAQQRAKIAKSACSSLVLELEEPLQLLPIKISAASKNASEGDLAPIRNLANEALSLHQRASTQFGTYDHSASDPGKEGLSVTEYNQMERAFQGVLAELTMAKRKIDEAETSVKALSELSGTVSLLIEECERLLTAADHALTAVQTQGYKTESLQTELGQGRATLTDAKNKLANRQLNAAKGSADSAQSTAAQVTAKAQALPVRKSVIDQQVNALAARIAESNRLVDGGKVTFDGIIAEYPESCWDSIKGNGTEAENRIEWSEQALEDAKTASTMGQQEWDRAQQLLSNATHWLDEVISFMRSIVALQENLTKAKKQAPIEVAAAKKDIETARSYIGRYDDDVKESLEDDLLAAQRKLEEAEQALAHPQPDNLLVIRLALEANSAADHILDEAQGEHEAAERLRRQAASAVTEAELAVSKAKEYIEDHQFDVSESTKALSRSARRSLDEAVASSDVESKKRIAEGAKRTADEALTAAKNEVNRSRPSTSTWGTVIVSSPSPSYRPSTTTHRPSAPSVSRPRTQSSPTPSRSTRIGGSSSIGSSRRIGSSGKW